MIFQLLTDEDIAFCKKELNEVGYADGKQTQNISKLYNIKENKETPVDTVLGKYIFLIQHLTIFIILLWLTCKLLTSTAPEIFTTFM
jgi:hypothetical protein